MELSSNVLWNNLYEQAFIHDALDPVEVELDEIEAELIKVSTRKIFSDD